MHMSVLKSFNLRSDRRLKYNKTTLSCRWQLSYRKQSIDLLRKSMDWFLYDNGHRHERVKLENNSVKFLWREKKYDHNQYFEEPQSLFEFTQR